MAHLTLLEVSLKISRFIDVKVHGLLFLIKYATLKVVIAREEAFSYILEMFIEMLLLI